MKADKPPVRWLKSYWDEEDILYFFEIDEDTWTLRQIELQGPMQTPIAAAALAEWPDPTADGLDAIRAYESKYGRLADQRLSENEPGWPHEDITREEFEAVWRRARTYLEVSTGSAH